MHTQREGYRTRGLLMYRLITYPFNVGVALTIAMLLSFLNYSYFYDPLSSVTIMTLLIMIMSYFLIGLFINRKKPVVENT